MAAAAGLLAYGLGQLRFAYVIGIDYEQVIKYVPLRLALDDPPP